MSIPKKLIPLLAVILLSSACGSAQLSPTDVYSNPLTVGNKKILVEIADTPQKKQQGLSGREKLKDNQGMLFDFSDVDNALPGFWMKQMKFDLDLIWIKNNPSTVSTGAQGGEQSRTTGSGRIVGITADVPHPQSEDDKLPLYYPPGPVDQVLEVNAGWSRENGIKIGDEVKLIDKN